jgi:hypothetical protein
MVHFRGKLRPKMQVLLLLFWTHISCPWELKKQEYGEALTIIGLHVDIRLGTITLFRESVQALLDGITSFLNGPHHPGPTLREWQRLTGHINWLLNVLPWGRPAVTEMYRKMGDKKLSAKGIPLNAQVRRDLLWLVDVIPRAIGVRLFLDGDWNDNVADMVFYTDASLRIALSYVFAGNGYFYPLQLADNPEAIDIFFLEEMAIVSAIFHAASLPVPPKRVLIFSDSLDSVEVFNSLHTRRSMHNAPLLATATIVMQSGVDIRVRHVPGKENLRADLLSRALLDDYKRLFPADRIYGFTPPRHLLPECPWTNAF